MPRKTKLTKELQDRITSVIAAGNYLEVAYRLAGVSHETFYRWLRLGEQGRRPYSEFYEAVKKAEAAAEAKRILVIQKASEENWQAAAWYLERRYPERWGRPSV